MSRYGSILKNPLAYRDIDRYPINSYEIIPVFDASHNQIDYYLVRLPSGETRPVETLAMAKSLAARLSGSRLARTKLAGTHHTNIYR